MMEVFGQTESVVAAGAVLAVLAFVAREVAATAMSVPVETGAHVRRTSRPPRDDIGRRPEARHRDADRTTRPHQGVTVPIRSHRPRDSWLDTLSRHEPGSTRASPRDTPTKAPG